jgi:hypothetical protein
VYIRSTTGFGTSVAKGPKCRPQNTKGTLTNSVWPEKLTAEFSLDFTEKSRKGAELLKEYYSHKKLKILAEKILFIC